MNKLTKEELVNLANPREGWCVSIYMPTVDKTQEIRQNPIRFKNLVDQAEEILKEAGLDSPEVRKLFKPLQSLVHDEVFWQYQGQGLAVFLAQDFLETYQLPMPVEEMVLVNDRFYLKPLLPLLYAEDEFYILALSQKNVRLLRATEHEVEEVEVPNLPKTMDEALPYDQKDEKSIQWHTQTSEPAGHIRAAQFHGHGDGEEDKNRVLRRFLGKVDAAVSEHLKDSRAPLILAGVEYLPPIYREVNSYKHLSDEVIHGSPKLEEKDRELRDEAWKLIKPVFQTTKSEIAGQFRQLSGWKDQRAVKDVKEIVKAAPYGRVEVLFVDKNAKKWGTFDEQNIDVKFEDDRRPGNQDLLDFAAIQTLLNGGTVFAVEPEELPEGASQAAAIFRY